MSIKEVKKLSYFMHVFEALEVVSYKDFISFYKEIAHRNNVTL